jgi:hypothetical protein
MSTLKVGTIQNASGVEVYTCKAWVNFNGTFSTSPFTTANGGIRAAGNVSSVTDNGTGNYTVNFTTAMPDANYVITGMGQESNSSRNRAVRGPMDGLTTTTSFRITTVNAGNGDLLDFLYVHVAVIR